MNLIRSWPLRRKLTLATMAACIGLLALAMLALFVFQTYALRQTAEDDLGALAEVVAASLTEPVAQQDRAAAARSLSTLRAKRHVMAAWIVDQDGRPFAAHGLSPSSPGASERLPLESGHRYAQHELMVAQPIRTDREVLGVLCLRADLRSVSHELRWLFLGTLSLLTLVSLVVAWLLSGRLQRTITEPLLELSEVARAVAERKDYSARAMKRSDDEIGQLTDAFNEMVAQIQSHDAALREVNATTQAEIQQRQRTEEELRRSRQRYEVAVLGSSDGLWDWDLVSHTIYFSPRWKTMLGYEDAELQNRYEEWEERLHPDDCERTLRAMQEYLAGARPTYEVEYRLRHRDGSYRWILSRGAALWDDQGRPFRMAGSHTDVTARRRADQELEKLNAQLLEASRRAGMAEVATGVLHNVGNVLNSVNVSATLVKDFVAQSRIPGLAKLSALLESHREDLATFLTSDDKGRQAIDYLTQLSRQLVFEQSEMLRELDALTRHVGHIKEIVAMQQSYADVAGVVECVSIPELLEDALRINTAALARHQVDVVRDFQSVPDIHVDKHKILQVLVNLISNAKHALAARPPGARRMTLRVGPNDNGRIHIQVQDNGVGIPPENLTRIFSHGFTTRKGGHGFGLHSGALAAKEMGGRLTAHSDGLDRGATFTLELPLPIRRETPNPPRVEAMLSSASRSTSPPVPLPS